ncbi:polymeric immunoglobulin receptor-like [Clarias magur]|nr:polymeric immunoglobulin receptor-like [Clarias magur]
MLQALIGITSLMLFVIGSSNGKTVQQTPRGLIKSQGELAEVKCSHDIISFSVKQSPDLSAYEGQNATLECTQVGTTYNGMYWFRKRPAESLELMVFYYVTMETIEEKFKQKVSARRVGSSLELTVKELRSTDSAVYFCAKQEARRDKLVLNLNKNCTCFSVKQSPDLSAYEGQNATLECTQVGTTYNGMYWFRKRPAESLELMVFYYVTMETIEEKFKQKVSARKVGSFLELTVKELRSTDSAVYFCAKQEARRDKLVLNLNKN